MILNVLAETSAIKQQQQQQQNHSTPNSFTRVISWNYFPCVSHQYILPGSRHCFLCLISISCCVESGVRAEYDRSLMSSVLESFMGVIVSTVAISREDARL